MTSCLSPTLVLCGHGTGREQGISQSTFLCGLFHNIGKPIILDALISLEDEMGRRLDPDEVTLAIDEYHIRVGGKIGREWRLPPQVTESIKLEFDKEGISIPYPQRDIHVIKADGADAA